MERHAAFENARSTKPKWLSVCSDCVPSRAYSSQSLRAHTFYSMVSPPHGFFLFVLFGSINHKMLTYQPTCISAASCFWFPFFFRGLKITHTSARMLRAHRARHGCVPIAYCCAVHARLHRRFNTRVRDRSCTRITPIRDPTHRDVSRLVWCQDVHTQCARIVTLWASHGLCASCMHHARTGVRTKHHRS